MARALRPRRARPNYAALLEVPDDNESVSESLSSKRVVTEEDNSGSDFAPEDNAGAEHNADEEDEDMNVSEPISEPEIAPAMDIDEDEDEDEEADVAFSTARNASSAPKGKANSASTQRSTIQLAPGLKRPANRQQHSLPLPSMHHRHRAVPLYARTARVERLEESARPFKAAKTTFTNSGTGEQKVLDRTNKAWGCNIGPGPLWEMVEDRAWFKEAVTDEEEHLEAKRRPRVHADVLVVKGWIVLDKQCVPMVYCPFEYMFVLLQSLAMHLHIFLRPTT